MKKLLFSVCAIACLIACNKAKEEKTPEPIQKVAIDSFSTQHYKILERTDYHREFKSKGPGIPGYDEVNTQTVTTLGYTDDIRFDTLFDKREILYQGIVMTEATETRYTAVKSYYSKDMKRVTLRNDSIFVFTPGYQSQMVSETSTIRGVRL
ncbi:MAG TPA: hypothetical protein VL092_10020 [Chitinophagaceae bacterium]|nr:hypothetical protein [Chitinophagaceae bacterium]